MALIKYQAYAVKNSGLHPTHAAPEAEITVFHAGTDHKAPIFRDAVGLQPLTNPFAADAVSGFFTFWVELGIYDIRIRGEHVPAEYVWDSVPIGTYTPQDVSVGATPTFDSLVLTRGDMTLGSVTLTGADFAALKPVAQSYPMVWKIANDLDGSGLGLLTHVSSSISEYVTRKLVGTASQIEVTNGDGQADADISLKFPDGVTRMQHLLVSHTDPATHTVDIVGLVGQTGDYLRVTALGLQPVFIVAATGQIFVGHEEALPWGMLDVRSTTPNMAALSLKGLGLPASPAFEIHNPADDSVVFSVRNDGTVTAPGLPAATTTLEALTDTDISAAVADQSALVFDQGTGHWHDQLIHRTLDSLEDTNLGTPIGGNILQFDGPTKLWMAKPSAFAPILHQHAIPDLFDTEVVNPQDSQVLQFETASGKWKNKAVTATGPNTLAALSDTQITLPMQADHVLRWDATVLMWVNKAASAVPTHNHALVDLTDTVLTTPTVGQQLRFNTGGKWENFTPSIAAHDTLAALLDTTITNPQDQDVLLYNGTAWINLPKATLLAGHDHNTLYNTKAEITTLLAGKLPITAVASDLADVTYGGAVGNGEVLTWVTDHWENQAHPAGVVLLSALNDTNVGTPADGQVLTFRTSDSKWHSEASAVGGVTEFSALNDTDVKAGVAAGDMLRYTAASKWESFVPDFALTGHTHADIYTKTEADALLAAKADSAHQHSLNSLSNVTVTAPADGHYLKYEAASSSWKNAVLPAGVVTIASQHDVTLGTLAQDHLLFWDVTASRWVNKALDPYAALNHNHDTAYYPRADVDTALALKANAADVYTKAAADLLLVAKADAATTYSMTQVDGLLGQKADATHDHALGDLTTVTLAAPAADQVLTFNGTTNQWINKALPVASNTLEGLDDTLFAATPQLDDILGFDSSKWVNRQPPWIRMNLPAEALPDAPVTAKTLRDLVQGRSYVFPTTHVDPSGGAVGYDRAKVELVGVNDMHVAEAYLTRITFEQYLLQLRDHTDLGVPFSKVYGLDLAASLPDNLGIGSSGHEFVRADKEALDLIGGNPALLGGVGLIDHVVKLQRELTGHASTVGETLAGTFAFYHQAASVFAILEDSTVGTDLLDGNEYWVDFTYKAGESDATIGDNFGLWVEKVSAFKHFIDASNGQSLKVKDIKGFIDHGTMVKVKFESDTLKLLEVSHVASATATAFLKADGSVDYQAVDGSSVPHNALWMDAAKQLKFRDNSGHDQIIYSSATPPNSFAGLSDTIYTSPQNGQMIRVDATGKLVNTSEIRLSADGKVGIGVDPTTQLHVKSPEAAVPGLRVDMPASATADSFQIVDGAGKRQLGFTKDHRLELGDPLIISGAPYKTMLLLNSVEADGRAELARFQGELVAEGANVWATLINPTIRLTHPSANFAAGLYVHNWGGTLDAGAALDSAASVLIAGAPTVGTNRHALWVREGRTTLAGEAVIGTQGGHLDTSTIEAQLLVSSQNVARPALKLTMPAAATANAFEILNGAGAKQLVVDKDGKLGMGIDAPVADLHVRATGKLWPLILEDMTQQTVFAKIESHHATGQAGIQFKTPSKAWNAYVDSQGRFGLADGASNVGRFYLTSGGAADIVNTEVAKPALKLSMPAAATAPVQEWWAGTTLLADVKDVGASGSDYAQIAIRGRATTANQVGSTLYLLSGTGPTPAPGQINLAAAAGVGKTLWCDPTGRLRIGAQASYNTRLAGQPLITQEFTSPSVSAPALKLSMPAGATAYAQEWWSNGQRAALVRAKDSETMFYLPPRDLGDDKESPRILIGNNTNTGPAGPCPGTLHLMDASGKNVAIWVDKAGKLRISNSSYPTGSTASATRNSETFGNVVGTQT